MVDQLFLVRGAKRGAIGQTRYHVDSRRTDDISSLWVMPFLPNLSMVDPCILTRCARSGAIEDMGECPQCCFPSAAYHAIIYD